MRKTATACLDMLISVHVCVVHERVLPVVRVLDKYIKLNDEIEET